MEKIELKNALDYELYKSYNLFIPIHMGLSYSDISCYEDEEPRENEITTFLEYQRLLEETNVFFIVLGNNKVVGYVMFDVYENGKALINEIAISRKYRRKGFGKKAIKRLIEILSDYAEITQIKVYSATIGTDEFYVSCGFEWISEATYVYLLKS